MKKMKKILSGITAAALTFGSMSAYVAEAALAGATEVGTLADLKTAVATPNANIKLTAPITLDATLSISGNVTIDLNGKTLTAHTGGSGILVNNGGTLKITDSSTGATGKFVNPTTKVSGYLVQVVAGGTFTLEKGTLESASANLHSYIIETYGTVKMTGGKINNNDGSFGCVKVEEDTGKFIMSGGEIKSRGSIVSDFFQSIVPAVNTGSNESYACAVTNFGTTEISGGTVDGFLWADQYSTFNSKITVKDDATIKGYIQVGSSQGTSASATIAPELSVEGGTVDVIAVVWTSETTQSGSAAAGSGQKSTMNGKVNITGGEVKVDKFVLPTKSEVSAKGQTATITVADTEDVKLTLGDHAVDETGTLPDILTDAVKGNENVTDKNGKPIAVSATGAVESVPIRAGSVKITSPATDAKLEADGRIVLDEGKKTVTVVVDTTAGTGYTVVADETNVTDKNVVVVGGTYDNGKITATVTVNETSGEGAIVLKYKVADGTKFGDEVALKTINVIENRSTYVEPTTPTTPTTSKPTSSEATSSEPTSSEATSSEATSSEATSSEATSSEPTSSEAASSGTTTDSGDNTSSGTPSNPATGIAMAIAPVVFAGAITLVLAKKSKK